MRDGRINKVDLKRYDPGAWIHMTFYKLAVYYSFVVAAAVAGYLAGSLGWATLKAVLAVYWILLTPSYYSVVKGMAMVLSRGVIMGHIAENLRERIARRLGPRLVLLKVYVAASLALWFASLAAFVYGG